MITEDYISFELAKLLKEKGFDEVCYLGYNKNGEYVPTSNRCNSKIIQPDFCFICCPTLQMAKKWLKIVHNIGIFPSTYTFSNADGSEEYHPYGCAVIDLKTYELLTNNIFPRGTEEDTVEEAIKFCLKNLI